MPSKQKNVFRSHRRRLDSQFPLNDTGLPPLPLACATLNLPPTLGPLSQSRLFVVNASALGVVAPNGIATCDARSSICTPSGPLTAQYGAIADATSDGVDVWFASAIGAFRVRGNGGGVEQIDLPQAQYCSATSVATSTKQRASVAVSVAFGFNCSSIVGLLARAQFDRRQPHALRWLHFFTPGAPDRRPVDSPPMR